MKAQYFQRHNRKIKPAIDTLQHALALLCALTLTTVLASCGSDEAGAGGNSGTGGPYANVISAKHFVLSFSDLNPQVVGPGVIYTGITVTVIVTAGNRYDAVVGSGTVYFRTEVGLLSASSCQLSAGTCSITWTSVIDGADVPADAINTITAWTLSGEDGFVDNNSSGVFDAGDTLTDDMGDPFLDITHDGTTLTYDAGIDLLVIPRAYNAPNGLYNGPECDSTPPPSCGTSSTVIFDTNEMDLAITATP